MLPAPLLIVGLGNPGPEYTHTRHNLGFLALDHLADNLKAEPFRLDKKFLAEIASVIYGGKKILLAKPVTFMNESGRAVRALVDFYKLGLESLVVFHDDLDIAPGTLRETDSSRSAGHNGVQSIIDVLGTQNFHRLRLGIGRPTEVNGYCTPSHDYVLQNFSEEEKKNFPTLFAAVESAIQKYVK